MDTDAAEDLDVEFPSARKGVRKMPEASGESVKVEEKKEKGEDKNAEGGTK
jgi:hypothetical protein